MLVVSFGTLSRAGFVRLKHGTNLQWPNLAHCHILALSGWSKAQTCSGPIWHTVTYRLCQAEV